MKEVEVSVTRWFEVLQTGQPLEFDPITNIAGEEGSDTDRQKPTYAAPFATCRISANNALLANQVHLTET